MTTRSRVLEKYLTTKDVADRFGLEVRQVQYYIKRGVIPAERVGRNKYFYLIHEDDVPDEWPPN